MIKSNRNRKRVLIVGSGKRVQNSILPALTYLGDDYIIQGVTSKTNKNHQQIRKNWDIPTSTRIRNFDLSRVDWIVIAVDLNEVPVVIKEICSCSMEDKEIFLDTPVLDIQDLSNMSLLKKFKKVYTTEESVVLPQFRMAKNLIDQGKIGALKRIWLFHSGYKYHAIATIRSLVNDNNILKIHHKEITKQCFEIIMNFKNGVTATIIEPRDYNSGRFLISGTNGLIADYDINTDMINCPVYKISYLLNNNSISSFTLNNKKKTNNILDERFFDILDISKIPKPSINNQLKIRALMDYFYLIKCDNSYSGHNYKDGIYDNILSNLPHGLKYWYDPLGHFKMSSLIVMTRFIIFLKRFLHWTK